MRARTRTNRLRAEKQDDRRRISFGFTRNLTKRNRENRRKQSVPPWPLDERGRGDVVCCGPYGRQPRLRYYHPVSKPHATLERAVDYQQLSV